MCNRLVYMLVCLGFVFLNLTSLVFATDSTGITPVNLDVEKKGYFLNVSDLTNTSITLYTSSGSTYTIRGVTKTQCKDNYTPIPILTVTKIFYANCKGNSQSFLSKFELDPYPLLHLVSNGTGYDLFVSWAQFYGYCPPTNTYAPANVAFAFQVYCTPTT